MSTIIQNVSALFDTYFPNASRFGSPAVEAHAPLTITLGNNDVLPNYHLPLTPPNASANASAPMLQQLARDWQHELSAQEYADVRYGGYYARPVLPGLVLISLNTLVYSTSHTPDTSNISDPNGQFAWLQSQLAAVRANSSRTYIIGHIPPVVDSFNLEPMWQPQYVDRYQHIISSFSDVIAAQLFGHFHSEEFRADPGWSATPVLLTSAVSPVYGCNPSYRVVTFRRRDYALHDFCVHATPLAQDRPALHWNISHCARSQYGLSDLGVDAWRAAALQLTTSCATLAPFLQVYMEGVLTPCGSTSDWRCLFTTVRAADFAACRASTTPAPTTSPATEAPSSSPRGVSVVAVAIAVPIATISLIAIFLFLRFRRARKQAGYMLVEPSERPTAGDAGRPHVAVVLPQ